MVHTNREGVNIKLNVAMGWPLKLFSPIEAERLATELMEAAKKARKLLG